MAFQVRDGVTIEGEIWTIYRQHPNADSMDPVHVDEVPSWPGCHGQRDGYLSYPSRESAEAARADLAAWDREQHAAAVEKLGSGWSLMYHQHTEVRRTA